MTDKGALQFPAQILVEVLLFPEKNNIFVHCEFRKSSAFIDKRIIIFVSIIFTECFTEDSSAEFITSARGKRLILLDGYKFYRKGSVGAKSRWLCSTHNSKGCNAILHTVDDEVVLIKNYHNHPPPKSSVQFM